MAKKDTRKVVKKSFLIGFAVQMGAMLSEYGLMGVILIGVLAIVGETVGFKFDRWKLAFGGLVAMILYFGVGWALKKSLGSMIERETRIPDVGPVVNMSRDAASGAYKAV